MNALLAVARQEISQRWAVFVAAPVVALIPLLISMHGSVRWIPYAEAVLVGAAVVAIAFGLILAISLGASVAAPGVANGSLTYLFAKPIHTRAIWGGRLGAALVLTLAGSAIAFAPGLIVARLSGAELFRSESSYGYASGWLSVLPAVAVLFAFVFAAAVGHAVSGALRSGSKILAIDAVALAVALTSVWYSAEALLEVGAFAALTAGGVTYLVLALAGVLAAGYAYLEAGRTDARRGHAALSVTLWSSLAVATLLFGGFAYWLLHPSPSRLGKIEGVHSARGDTVVIGGQARRGGFGLSHAFIVDAGTGESIHAETSRWNDFILSGDGSTAVGIAMRAGLRDATPWKTVVARRSGERHGLGVSAFPFAVTHGGHRFASRDEGKVAVHDSRDGSILAVAKVDGTPTQAMFPGDDRLRITSVKKVERDGTPSGFIVAFDELSVSPRRLARTGVIHSEALRVIPVSSRDGSRVILFAGDQAKMTATLHDGRSGALLSKVGSADARIRALFLADGRFAMLSRDESSTSVSLYDANGALLRRIPLPHAPGSRLGFGSEYAPGRVIVFTARGDAPAGSDWRSTAVDLMEGRVVGETRARPAVMSHQAITGGGMPDPGSAATMLFIDAAGRLITWNPASGGVRPLVMR
jgi:hypothetical protein